MHPTTAFVAVSLLAAAGLPAQQAHEAKLHPYLQEQMQTAAAGTQLPVYFVMADRLGYEHWFPRVFAMDIEQRRATVMAELQEHAARSQEDLVYYLRLEQAAGRAKNIGSNWLGNFVRVEAGSDVILTAAALESVREVWYDYVPPLDQVEDTVYGDQPLTPPVELIGPPPPLVRTPGPGPTVTRADMCWTLGFEGQGVVIMNSDSGIDTQGTGTAPWHRDLVNRFWVNPGEGPTPNGIDDDRNGKVDDIWGWDFGNNNGSIDDNGGHGSNTAGCLVADGTFGNGTGTTYGMAPEATFMTGQLSGESSQWDSVQYAIAMGAHTQTSSHSYKLYFNPPPNYKMHRDIGEASLAAGLIRTNSTSNDGSRCGSSTNAARKPFNISAPGNLPPPYLDPNQTLQGNLGGVIGVGAYDWGTQNLKSYSPCGPFAWHFNDVLVNRSSYPAANWDMVNDNDYPWSGGSQQGLLKPDIASPTGTTTTDSAPSSYTTFSGTSNATPVANGCLAIWKGANMSLTPEDIGMIVHQSADDRGSVAGKENDWGAGLIDCYAGLLQALCVHRVDGQSAWEVDHSVSGGNLDVALDGVPGSLGVMIIGFARQDVAFGPVTVGVGSFFGSVFVGNTDAAGDASVSLPINPAAIGLRVYTQGFIWDLTHTNSILESNVIGVDLDP